MALNMAEVQLNRQLSEQPRSYPSELRVSDDSDFEFDHSHNYSNEPPPSPKLHNFSPSWQRGMVSTTHASQAEHIYTAAPIFQHFHVMDALHHGSDTILQSPDKYSYDATHDISHSISTTEELGDYMLDAAVMSLSADQREKERPNLRSLMLNSKNLEQLPLFVAAYQSTGAPGRKNVDQEMVRSCSSSSSSDASSSTSTSASFSSSSSTSSPQLHKRKSRRWSFLKLDFLHSKVKASATKSVNPPHDHGVYHVPDVHHDAAETGDGKIVSPRKSTGSWSSMYSRGSSAVTAQKEMKMGRQKNGGASAPVSPAASPSRAPLSAQLGPGAHLKGWRPSGGAMSPHAQHYQQQRARAEEARKRTFLPYRHSLLIGPCLFPPSRSRLPRVAY
ncbi:hypothetical protein L7F22_067207 [Adiantum nelumboides]|nr:hypothetical protein [Adiantum nelumboides]